MGKSVVGRAQQVTLETCNGNNQCGTYDLRIVSTFG